MNAVYLKRLIIFTIFLYCCFMIGHLFAQAVLEQHLFGASSINAITEQGSRIYVGTDIGLFKVNDATGEWTLYDRTNTPMQSSRILSLKAISNGILLVGTYNGLYTLQNDVWTLCTYHSAGTHPVNIYAVDVDDNGLLWILDDNLGLYSYDGWAQDYICSTPIWGRCFCFNSTHEDVWIGATGGLRKTKLSNNVITDYTTQNSSLPSDSITALVCDNNGSIWVGTTSGLVKITDESWTVMTSSNSGLVNSCIKGMSLSAEGTLWIATDGGLCCFNNGVWSSWTTANSNLTVNQLSRVFVSSNGVKLGGQGFFINFTNDTFSSVPLFNTPFINNTLKEIMVDDRGDVWMSAAAYYIYRLGNGQLSWLYRPELTQGITCFSKSGSRNIYVGFDQGLALTNGTTWMPVTGTESMYIRDVDYYHGTTVCGTWGSGFLVITDSTFNSINQVNSSLDRNNVSSVCIDHNEHVWIGTNTLLEIPSLDVTNSIWTHHGQIGMYDWESVFDLNPDGIQGVWFSFTNLGILQFDGNIYASQFNYPDAHHIKLDRFGRLWFIQSDMVYCHENGIFIEIHNFNSYNDHVYALDIDSMDRVWVTTNTGVYVYYKPPVANQDPNNNHNTPILNNVSLYPNPFRSALTIDYRLEKDSNVELSLYNLRGQKIQTIIQNHLTLGHHQTVWNGEDSHKNHVPSGVYFLRLKTGDQILVRKVLLLK